MSKAIEEEYLTLTIKYEEDGEIYFVYTSNYMEPAYTEIKKDDELYDVMLETYVRHKNEILAESSNTLKRIK